MPFVPVANAAKVEHLATIYGRDMVNVLGASYTPPITHAELLAAAEDLAGSWETNMAGFAEAPYVYKGCRVTLLDTVDGDQALAPRDTPGAGASDHNMPPSLAACVSLHTASRSRSGRGRFYWPIIRQAGVDETNTTHLAETYRTSLVTNFNLYMADAVGTDLKPAVVSRTDALARLITTWAVDPRVDHQRRRDG